MNYSKLLIAILIALGACKVNAKDHFNYRALEIENPQDLPEDLSLFSEFGKQAPGRYHVTVYLNQDFVDEKDIEFVADENGALHPLLTASELMKWGVRPSYANNKYINGAPERAEKIVAGAQTAFDFSTQKLSISIPQAYVDQKGRGYVDPELWDEGVSALLLSYDFSGNNTRGDDSDSDNYFLSLRSGVNLGAWRLRNFSTGSYNKSKNTESSNHWDSLSTYIQRDIKMLKSQLTIGDSYTPSDVFESIQFVGAKLTSDENMIPDSLRGYAPTIRGIANSSAKVTVKQNNSVIYSTNVSAGPFVIDDIYPLTSSGTLQVEVEEMSGIIRTFTQAFSTVPIMQREGHLKYSLVAGESKATYSYQDDVPFAEGTAIYGLPNDVTVYGGFFSAEKYKSVALGAGYSLGYLGSLSTDVTQSWAQFSDDNDKEGRSYRFQYAKTVEQTGSTFTLAGYRYSTKGYYDFSEFNDHSSYENNDFFNVNNNKRSKVQLDYTQRIADGSYGSLSFSGYQQDYWNESGSDRSLNVSYNNTWNSINWSMMYTLSRYANTETETDHQFSLMLSIPLSRFLPHSYATMGISTDNKGHSNYRVGMSGSALENNNLNYSVYEGYSSQGVGNSGGMSTTYSGSSAVVNGGYSYNQQSRQFNYGIRGAAIAHPHGITLAQPIDSDLYGITIVAAPGAKNIKVKNNTGVTTDSRGYAVVTYNNPYKVNRIALDTTSFGDNFDIDNNVQHIVPTSGAVVYADFKTRLGSRALVTLRRVNGSVVPFGATATMRDDTGNASIVGDNGQVYLTGVNEDAVITVSWGSSPNEKCQATIPTSKGKDNSTGTILSLDAVCK